MEAAADSIRVALISRDCGIHLLQQADTDREYHGLGNSVRLVGSPTRQRLTTVNVDSFQSIETSPPVDAMTQRESIMTELVQLVERG